MLYMGVIIATQIIGSLFFREIFNRKSAITLALLAAAFVIYNGLSPSDLLVFGLYIGLIAGVFEAITYAVRKKDTSLTKESITLAQTAGALVIGIVLLSTVGGEVFVSRITVGGIVATLVLGAIYVGIGYLITYGMRHFSLSVGSVVLSSDLLFALVINAIVIHQIPTVQQVLGSCVLFVCIIYSTSPVISRRKVLDFITMRRIFSSRNRSVIPSGSVDELG